MKKDSSSFFLIKREVFCLVFFLFLFFKMYLSEGERKSLRQAPC